MTTRLSLLCCLLVAACADRCDGGPLPAADVELVTDALGITHVYAKSDRDALFGAGYAMARDRLFQMEHMKRRALGTWAEVAGDDAAIAADKQARTFGFGRLGRLDYERVSREHEQDARLVEAWAAGVTARVEEVRSGAVPLPPGFGPDAFDFLPEPWTAVHAFAVAKVLAFGLSSTLDHEVLTTLVTSMPSASKLPVLLPAHDTTILPTAAAAPDATVPPTRRHRPPTITPELLAEQLGTNPYRPMFESLASNNWAVHGAHTHDGRPLLAGDPHQPVSSPIRFYPLHISSVEGGGSLDVIGFSFVGTPGVQLGHNARVGWTATTNYADVMDLWDVETDTDLTVAYLGSEEVAIRKRTEPIRVRAEGRPVGEGEELAFVVHEVPGYGILLPEALLPVPKLMLARGEILFNWTGFDASTEGAAYFGFGRARNLDEWERAVDLLEVGAVNLVAADAEGIGYRVAARVPDRGPPAGRDLPWRVVSGWDSESFWTRGDLPKDRLPRLRNPPSGFISSANNDPFGFTLDGRVDNDPFYYGAIFANGLRAFTIEHRLRDLIADGRKVDRAQMEALQLDVSSPLADTLLPHLDRAVAAIPTDAKLERFRGDADLVELNDRLKTWDRRFQRDSSDALVFFAFEWFLARRVFRSAVGVLFESIAAKSPGFFLGQLVNVFERRFADADSFLPNGSDEPLVAALDDTARWLRERFDTLDAEAFRYGGLHAVPFANALLPRLDAGRTVVDGSIDSINVASSPFFANDRPREQFDSIETPLYRMVIAFAEDGVPEATVAFPRGASEDPDSPFWDNAHGPWSRNEYTKLAFRREDVAAAAVQTTVLPSARR